MQINNAKYSITLLLISACIGCSSTTKNEQSNDPVSPYAYNISMVSQNLEFLHRANINDLKNYKDDVENEMASNVIILWAGINQRAISVEEKKRSYDLLRLIAVQNEKFPIPSLNKDQEVRSILEAAIKNDPEHTAILRSKDWSKPKWVSTSCK